MLSVLIEEFFIIIIKIMERNQLRYRISQMIMISYCFVFGLATYFKIVYCKFSVFSNEGLLSLRENIKSIFNKNKNVKTTKQKLSHVLLYHMPSKKSPIEGDTSNLEKEQLFQSSKWLV